MWASANVGSSIPNESGMYFSWGNPEGHAEGSGFEFSQEAYNLTPASSIEANLSLEEDIARVNLGTPWRMPSIIECEELYSNCNVEWTIMGGIPGVRFTSKLNSNWLFFPASGNYSGTSLLNSGSVGFIWTRTYISETSARCLEVSESFIHPRGSGFRWRGLSVRAVYDPVT